jgi:hypothetical protein
MHEQVVLARFRYNDLKEATRDLRRTLALCKFNGGKVGKPSMWVPGPTRPGSNQELAKNSYARSARASPKSSEVRLMINTVLSSIRSASLIRRR